MKEKLKKELIKILMIGSVFLIGVGFLFLVVLPTTQNSINNSLYQFGANATIKQTEECKIFNNRYIEEMNKQKEGHPMIVVEEAKKVGCKK